MGKLTAIKVKKAKPGRYSDGSGLCLLVKPSGARSWVLRVQVAGKRQDIGLGAVDDGAGRGAFGSDDPLNEISLMQRTSLTLAEAREKAAALRKLAKAGANPIAERDRERRAVPTFAEAVTEAHAALTVGQSKKAAAEFKTTLEKYANPKLGQLKVDAVGSAEVTLVLAPIWTGKPALARKVRVRIGQVLSYAKSQGWRASGAPDPRDLRAGLPRQPRAGNFPAMPYVDLPGFFAGQLAKVQSNSRMALLFTILTAARSGEVRKATWDQIDLKARTWARSAEFMKTGQPHTVTLNDAAVALLERCLEGSRKGLVFPGTGGRCMSDMTLSQIMRREGLTAVVHGFRSSFRDWAAERMHHIPDPVAEAALAHHVPEAVVAAYKRTKFMDLRRDLLDAWGRFVAPSLSGVGDNVVPMVAAERSA